MPEKPARVGVLCLGGIGDLLLASALTSGIRSECPQAAIELISSSSNAAALELNPHADSHFHAPATSPLRLLSLIRSRSYDILFDTSQWARLGAVLASLSGARLTAGFRTAGQYRSLGYDLVCEHSAKRHEVENFLELGRTVWPGLHGRPTLRLLHAPQERSEIVYCHMWPASGPGRSLKQWPEPYWAELIRNLVARGRQICLTGSAADAEGCARFKSEFFAGADAVQSIAGSCSLASLAEKFAAANAVIAVNTGIMHLAALAGAPLIALHGATDPRRWGPVSDKAISLLPRSGSFAYLNLGNEYPAHVQSAMDKLPVSAVLAAYDKLMAGVNTASY